MKILKFEKVGYCSERKIVTDNFSTNDANNFMVDISGSKVRNLIYQGKEIADYILRSSLLKELNIMMSNNPNDVFINKRFFYFGFKSGCSVFVFLKYCKFNKISSLVYHFFF